MDESRTDGFRMYLRCVAAVNSDHHVDMRWSGDGLQQQSHWVRQTHVTRQGGYVERKLSFNPWLDSHAGEYTCNLNVNDKFTVKKTIVVSSTLPYNLYIHTYTVYSNFNGGNAKLHM